ncbi:MAG TPA: SDR family NAD(P)-dependent oxidoreductase [Pseudonocardia sp.]|uniref:SDR family NAD(P)-dependent oxidoreductase n=1 Tax=Pseudonocardia sp. TaxID=60912 RepID=UPI002B4B67F4|nr:SDR family NAD(P)-dependent oxidoreductase [Pseudonocardia sp.]HLU57719.1 SDR family NAD(P)-dependent oxidoreductase [Pseudonocardia sp.]
MDLSLDGKVAIVTGAASGFGRAVATTLAAEGARVAGADINEAGVVAVMEELGDGSGSCRGYALDVTSRSSWSELVRAVEQDLGPVDILCNIAGPAPAPVSGHLDTDDDEWRRQIDGHLTGVFLGCQSVLPGMVERRYGKIVNMCSFTAHGTVANIPGYDAAFGGILAYTKDLARFAAPHNINVNCVSPGNIETPMTQGWMSEPGARERLLAGTPIGRIGQPEDVANWVVFLASDRARHAVGIEINVSGGQLIA